MFCDEEGDNVILRRDWEDGYVIQYNVLVNYDQLLKTAPNTMEQFRNNGLKLYQRYTRAGF